MRLPRFTLAIGILAFVCGRANAQTPSVTRDPNAVLVASNALNALLGLTTLSDLTLHASAAYTAGSDEESGPATLLARGVEQSLVALELTGGQRQEIRNGPAGAWSRPDGVQHLMAQHNALVPAVWFFPALVLAEALNDPSVQLAYLGPGAIGGVAVTHIRFWRVLPSGVSSDSAQLFGHLTAVDVYFAAANSLPVALDFNAHPDNNEKLDIPIEVLFGNYQTSNGISFPAHVQKFINNSLLLDLSITSVAVNSGIPASTFSIPATSAGGAQ